MNISDPRINDRIRVPEVRLVGPAGEQVGIVRIEDALRLAAEADLDLVEVAPQAKPPVCKLMDFGKYKYEAAVKAREARKNQTNTVLKEIRFRLKIDKHDYETKKGHALRFLGAGDKVKAMIQFRGREQQRPEMGIRLLQRFAEDVAEVGSIESTPRIDGRNMVMVIGPLKNKAEAKAEARRAAQRAADKAKAEAAKTASVTAEQSPLTQSLGDALPAEFLEAAKAREEAQHEASPETEQAADISEATAPEEIQPEEIQPEELQPEAPQAEEPQAEEPQKEEPEPEQPVAAEKPAPAARVAASKPAAAPRPSPAPAAPAAPAARPVAPKPAAASAARPSAPKPSATPKPAAPKPGAPRPSAGAPKPSAPKPTAPRPSGRRGN